MSDYSEQLDAENERKIAEIVSELPQFAKLYFDDSRRKKSTRTRLGYVQDVQRFFVWLQQSAGFKDVDLRTATPAILERLTFEDFEEYKSSMEFSERTDQRGNQLLANSATIARRLSALRSFMSFYFRIGAIKTNPAMYVSIPKIPDHDIIALNPEDIDRLLDAIYSTDGLTHNQIERRKKTAKRDAAILITLLGTGIRVSELVGLDCASVDFHNAYLTITLKGGNSGRAFFGAEVESALRDYMDSGRALLSPAPSEHALFISTRHTRMTVRAVELLVREYVERAGIANAGKITPHKLRATYGTQLYDQSGDIKLVASALHHKSVETTSRHYIRESEEHQRQVVKYSDALLGDGKKHK